MPDSNSHSRKRVYARVGYSALAVIALLVCVRGLSESALYGVSRIYTQYAQLAQRLDVANEAVRLTPQDPEAHYARALLLSYAGRTAEAAVEIEQAVANRPRDYVLWIELGSGRDHAGRRETALAAYREAVRLAPQYARPRWQLGNLLLRMGQREEAFAELRRAALSDPTLQLTAIDLAWTVTGGDIEAVEQALAPMSEDVRLTLAHYLVRIKKWNEAIKVFQAGGGPSGEDRNNLIKELIAAKQFKEAYQVWSGSYDAATGTDHAASRRLVDGGFETPLPSPAPGFGWQTVQDTPAVHGSQETTGRTGARSFRLEWRGDSNPDAQLLSQLILVEPKTQYTLQFFARTEEMVTGGSPAVSVNDAGNDELLARSPALPQGTNDWRAYAFSFNTGRTTSAILISVRRLSCNSAPCPAFGHVWLDDFALTSVVLDTESH